jgi:hypothetical protein
MKYTIEGLSQKKLIEWGLDATDAVIIRWFADWCLSGTMEEVHVDSRRYHWLDYSHLAEELPCLGIESPDAVARRFKKYVGCGLMAIHLRRFKTGGSRAYYQLVSEKWTELHREEKKDRDDPKVVSHGSRDDSGGGSRDDLKVGSDSPSNDSSAGQEGTAASPAAPTQAENTGEPIIAELFSSKYYSRLGTPPPWGKKEGALLRADLQRLGLKRLHAAVLLFFDDPPDDAAAWAMSKGFTYGIFHSQLPKLEALLARRTERTPRPCPHCGKMQPVSTSSTCFDCGKPVKESARA